MATHVCPWWVGYFLVSPLRRLFHNPDELLAAFVTPGMTVLDVGPGMGFFTLPLATMVGPTGRVVCVDVQERMLQALMKRARAAQLAARILTHVCEPMSLGLDDFAGRIDFALAFAVVHEMSDPPGFFSGVARLLKPGARCLVAEPRGHVAPPAFEAMLAAARQAGLSEEDRPSIRWSRTAVLKKDAYRIDRSRAGARLLAP